MSNIYDVCLIGLGPAGIGLISSLDDKMLKNSICFEKGTIASECIAHVSQNAECSHCDYCNIIYGLGGASRFSCGKVSNFPAGSGLEYFFESKDEIIFSLNEEIQKLSKALHLKKIDVCEETVNDMRAYFKKYDIDYKYYDVYEFERREYLQYINTQVKYAEDAGMKVFFQSDVLKVHKSTKQDVYDIFVKIDDKIKKYKAKKIVVATGNLSVKNLIDDIYADDIQATYELGIRISMPTAKIKRFLDCHGDLKLKYKSGRTYCVSKDGYIISYPVNDLLFLEGYTNDINTRNTTNLAVIIKSNSKATFDGLIKKYRENYQGIPIVQKYNDYLHNSVSEINHIEKYTSVQLGNIRELFDDDINLSIIDFVETVLVNALKLPKEDLIIFSPELKVTKNIKIKNDFQIANNVYVIGAATGKFRGILQSLCSGVRCSHFIKG